MYEGIYIWDAKYGVPNDSDIDSVKVFLEELQKKPKEVNHNLHGFAQDFDQFLNEAVEFYPEDRAINQNLGIGNYDKDEATDVVMFLAEMPEQSITYHSPVLDHYANVHNLVSWDLITEMVTPPTDPKDTADIIKQWQAHLTELKSEPSIEDQAPLPENLTQVKKLGHAIIKNRFAELGVQNFQIKRGEAIKVTFNVDDISVWFMNFFEKDIVSETKGVNRFFYEPTLDISIKGMKDTISISYFQFIKMGYRKFLRQDTFLGAETVGELKNIMEEGLKMIMHMYPHMGSKHDFYKFLCEAKHDKHLSRHYFSRLWHIDPKFLYAIGNSLGLKDIHDYFRKEYIDNMLFELNQDKKYFEAEEDRLEMEDENYTRYPYPMPSDPEAKFAQEFDDFVASIAKEAE